MGLKVTDFGIRRVNNKTRMSLVGMDGDYARVRASIPVCVPMSPCTCAPLYVPTCVRHYNDNRTINNISPLRIYVPKTELNKFDAKKSRFEPCSVVHVLEIVVHVDVADKDLLDLLHTLLPTRLARVSLPPEDMPVRGLGALVHQVVADKADISGTALLPVYELRAPVLCCGRLVEDVYDPDKCSAGFPEDALRRQFVDEIVQGGTSHLAILLHQLLLNHLRLGFIGAFNLVGRSVIAFTRCAVDEMRKQCPFEYLDYVPQRIFALGNLVAEITPVFPAPLVFLDTQPLVGKRDKALVTFRNAEMTCLVSLGQSKQFASLGVADITQGHNPVRAWVENLGVLVGHSDSNIKGIRFVVSPARADETFQVLYDEVVCSFVVYHYVLFNLFKGKNKTLTPPAFWYKGFYIMFGLRLQNISKSSHLRRLVMVQRYEVFSNPARNVNSELTFGRACSELRCRKIAAMRKSLCHNTLCAKSLRVEGCKFVVLNVVGSRPTGHPTTKPVDYQIVSGYFCTQNRPNPP